MSKFILSNVVGKKQLNEVRLKTLAVLRNALLSSFGPMGSNTLIKLKAGNGEAANKYTKDGFSIMKDITFTGPIEASVKEDILECSRYVALKVGDGTTSTVVLTSNIFEYILTREIDDDKTLADLFSPRDIVKAIKSEVEKLKGIIKSKYKEPTIDDIYNVALISTNGNEKLATEIKNIYAEYGMDVFIDLDVSSSIDSYIKAFDGMTIESGYSDPCYINTSGQESSIRDPKIYAFRDPIDTPEMMAFVDAIIRKNILIPMDSLMKIMKGKKAEVIPYVPTIIMAPRISADMSNYITTIVDLMRQVDKVENRPPLNIITNIYNEERYEDIIRMTGSKPITKYIDPAIQQKDIAAGIAPSIDTIDDFAGSADLVVSDVGKTKFVNPAKMINPDGSYTKEYLMHLNYLEDMLKEAYNEGQDMNVTGNLKRRINSLKANMIQYFVGGITAADRDSNKDLLEDAILNCRSTAQEGVGFGANVEGLLAIDELADNHEKYGIEENTLESAIVSIFSDAYFDIVYTLYNSSIKNEKECKKLVIETIERKQPYNLATDEFSDNVLTSLNTDITILDTVDKILSIMVTANQAIVHSPIYNTYSDVEEE